MNEKTFNVYIAQLVQLEIVSRSRGSHEVPVRQVGIELCSSDIKFMQEGRNPSEKKNAANQAFCGVEKNVCPPKKRK